MTRDLTIEEADLRAIVRLLGEVAILHGGLMVKRGYLLDGLCDFAGAQEWEWWLHAPKEPRRCLGLLRRRIGEAFTPSLPAAPDGTDVPLPEPGGGSHRIVAELVTDKVESRIALNRSLHERGYTERERHLTMLVLRELPWLHRWDTAPRARPKELSPRLQLVLDLLLIGLSRKDISAQIGISVGTVNAYVRDLYRHFNVNSHAGLMRLQGGQKTREVR